jgi:hypothetical protein
MGSTDTLAGSVKDSHLGSLTNPGSTTATHLHNNNNNSDTNNAATEAVGLSLSMPNATHLSSSSGTIAVTTSPASAGGAAGVTSPTTEGVRAAKPRPRANSKGLLGALEPIQERRRGSSSGGMCIVKQIIDFYHICVGLLFCNASDHFSIFS